MNHKNTMKLFRMIITGLLVLGLGIKLIMSRSGMSIEEFLETNLQNIPKVVPIIGLIIFAIIFRFLLKKYERRKFLLEYGFIANARIISITDSGIRINNVPLKNVEIEFNGTQHTIKHENPKTFEGKTIGDTIRVRYNSQNTEEFLVDPIQG